MSNQMVKTPRAFLDAVEARFGEITFDLAANSDNHVADEWFGPGGVEPDALVVPWDAPGLQFCNPPFKKMSPWVRRAAEMRKCGSRIALIGPAAVCTSWFTDWVAPHAYVFELTPRVFKNEIRDTILALYEPAGYLGRESWAWRK